MTIGLLGLGKMGSGIAKKLIEEGFEVNVWNRSSISVEELGKKVKSDNLKPADSIKDLVERLDKPRIIWIMVTHSAVDEVLAELKKYVSDGDVVIDGGNSHFKDTEKRYQVFTKLGIHFLGIGTSGGVHAAEKGFPFMVGGSKKGYEIIKPVLDALSKPNGGHEYFGEGGAGHFVKMIHNGIEYGIMQSIGEGFEVLEKSKYNLNLLNVAKLWQKGTLVSGFLMEMAKKALEKNSKLDDILGEIDASGEALWTIETAKEEGVNTEIIEQSLDYRRRSKNDKNIQESFTAKMVAALRREFGGHSVKKK